jgi:phosphoglycerate dehydrogenase-like enzyme
MKIVVAYRELPDTWRARLEEAAPEHRLVYIKFPVAERGRTPPQELLENLVDAHILFGYFSPPNLLDLAPNLRWLMVPAAGIERIISPQILTGKLLITNASGSSAGPIGEYILGGMLWFAKRIPAFAAARRDHRYERIPTTSLAGKTLGIVGYGAIGAATARLARAFDVRVLACRRSEGGEVPAEVDRLFPRNQLLDLIAASDFVALTVPLTEETRGLIGERELAAMRPDAVLINVARGGVIDEPALIRALQERRIGGAVLDVFSREPLPADSPLWDLDNVLMTPHISGDVDDYAERVFAQFADNLRRFFAGEPLLNLVDPALGY